jgi:hypothetical protein
MAPIEHRVVERSENSVLAWESEVLPTLLRNLRISTPQSGSRYKRPPPDLSNSFQPLPVWPIISTSQLVAHSNVAPNLDKFAQHAFQVSEPMEGKPEGHTKGIS